MKILLVGGGTGGHITPLLAVAHELKAQHPHVQLEYVLEKGNKFSTLIHENKNISRVHTIRAGKFRRYHGESFLKHLLDIPTILKNIRDFFYVIIGFLQSLYKVRRIKPDIVFIKGGFVAVPIGLACAIWRIPYITHDSDATAGLANRIISNWAKLHATGMPTSFYHAHAKRQLHYVGIPLSAEYHHVTDSLKKQYREEIDVPNSARLIAITGGSLGAVRLNTSVRAIIEDLLHKFEDLYIFHQTGNKDQNIYDDLSDELKKRVIEKPFVTNLYEYTGAADVVVTRAGATTIAELAVQQKACILVPNPVLTGGQQSKNAEHLANSNAVVVVTEEQAAQPHQFEEAISRLLKSHGERIQLEAAIGKLAKPNAAKEIAELIMSQVQR